MLTNRDNDNMSKRKELEQKYATAETEISSLRNDLRLALQRIADLQQALEEGDEDDDDDESSDRLESSYRANESNFDIFENNIGLTSSDMSDSSEESVRNQLSVVNRPANKHLSSNTINSISNNRGEK